MKHLLLIVVLLASSLVFGQAFFGAYQGGVLTPPAGESGLGIDNATNGVYLVITGTKYRFWDQLPYLNQTQGDARYLLLTGTAANSLLLEGHAAAYFLAASATAANSDKLDGNHSSAFALIGHNHDGVYAPVAHNHVGSDITSGSIDNLRLNTIAPGVKVMTTDMTSAPPDGHIAKFTAGKIVDGGVGGSVAAPFDYTLKAYTGGVSYAAGDSELANSLQYRNIVDLTNVTQVRVLTANYVNVLPSGSYIKGQYSTDGTTWYDLTNTAVVDSTGMKASTWLTISSLSGDYLVRILVHNNGSATNGINGGVHLQLK